MKNKNEKVTINDLVMLILSILGIINILFISFVEVDEIYKKLLYYTDFGICVIFLTNWTYKLCINENKKNFLKNNWIDLIASIPEIEALRAARVFHILRVVRLLRQSNIFISKLMFTRELTMAGLLLFTVLIIFISTSTILLLEANLPESNIKTAEQAIWWSLVTISTVGYGDYYPVTTMGRIFGGILIVTGVSFFGIISGFMSSLFIEKIERKNKSSTEEIMTDINKLQKNQEKILEILKNKNKT